MRNALCRTWNMTKKLKITDNEKYTLYDMNNASKTEKGGKFRNDHYRTSNMARKLKIMENDKHSLDDLKNDDITEKPEKREIHTLGPGIWREH